MNTATRTRRTTHSKLTASQVAKFRQVRKAQRRAICLEALEADGEATRIALAQHLGIMRSSIETDRKGNLVITIPLPVAQNIICA